MLHWLTGENQIAIHSDVWNMKVFLYSFFLISGGLCACTSKEVTIEHTVKEYCEVYSKRDDIERFISFYDDDVVFEDIIGGNKLRGKSAVMVFFDWGNPNFKKLAPENIIVSETIVQENKALVKGHFTKFQWGSDEFEAMHFSTLLHFNDAQKIVKQVDWINYPSTLINYNTRANSNDWLMQN